MLNIIDELINERLAISINSKRKAVDVIDVLSDLFILRGVPNHATPTTAPSSFVVKAVREWWPRWARIGRDKAPPTGF